MKKVWSFSGLATFLFIALFVFALSACSSGQNTRIDKNVGSTDLSSVALFDMQIGENIEEVDWSQFTSANKNEFWDYTFAEALINVDKSKNIIKILSREPLHLTAEREFNTTADVEDIFGTNHNDYWFDSEQRFRAYTYFDSKNKISMTAVFQYDTHELVWAILEKMSVQDLE